MIWQMETNIDVDSMIVLSICPAYTKTGISSILDCYIFQQSISLSKHLFQGPIYYLKNMH